MSDRHPQDDLMIVVALSQFSYQFESAYPEIADRAWELAKEISQKHGLEPVEVERQICWRKELH